MGLALAAWAGGLFVEALTGRLDTLAWFLIVVPVIVTGLPLYPLAAGYALYQSSAGLTPDRIDRLLPLH